MLGRKPELSPLTRRSSPDVAPLFSMSTTFVYTDFMAAPDGGASAGGKPRRKVRFWFVVPIQYKKSLGSS
jgi:hypothetical protein